MDKEPLVSVIMNCYNSDKYLKEAIDSVMSQTYLNWEIIFWDNQSTDGSAQIVKSYKDERIKYFYAPIHTPLGAARNEALKKINGKYIAFLDCDDMWKEEKLTLQIDLMEKNSKVGLCHSNYEKEDTIKNTKQIAHNKVLPKGNVSKNIVINYNNWRIGLSCVIISRHVVEEFNSDLFDNNLKLVEEYEFFCRVLKKFEIEYDFNVLTTFKWHGLNNSIKFQRNWSDEYSYMAEKFLNKNFSEKEVFYLNNTSVFYRIKSFLFDGLIIEAKEQRKLLNANSFKYLLLKILLLLPVELIKLLKTLWKRGAYA